MLNLHLFYKMFNDENSFFQIGFALDLIDVTTAEESLTTSYAVASNISNRPLVYPDINTFNILYGQKIDLSDRMYVSHVSGLEMIIPTGESKRDNNFFFRSNIELKSNSNDFSFGINYKIYMYLTGIEGYKPDFEDRFVNTIIPFITYNLNEKTSFNLGYHVYTHEDLEDFENRIEFGISF